MKKKLSTLASIICILGFTTSAYAGSVRIYNSDSRTHTIELNCSGSSKTVEVRGSTTATYTFHSTSSECKITGGTVDFPSSTLKNGQRWKFKNGKATSN